MGNTPLDKYTPAQIAAAIGRAKDYAAAQDVPLTVERLAAELEMELALFHRVADGSFAPTGAAARKKVALIRRACGEATASVVEHAMRRGSGTNMHLLYLKNNAGYDGAKAGKDKDRDGTAQPPVIFIGEESIAD